MSYNSIVETFKTKCGKAEVIFVNETEKVMELWVRYNCIGVACRTHVMPNMKTECFDTSRMREPCISIVYLRKYDSVKPKLPNAVKKLFEECMPIATVEVYSNRAVVNTGVAMNSVPRILVYDPKKVAKIVVLQQLFLEW